MNREEKIFATAKMYSLKNYGDDEDRAFAIKDFQAGAQWADDNQKSQWISVEERLPENYDTVLLLSRDYRGDCRLCLGNWLIASKKWIMNGGDKILKDFTPVYWLPIPELPIVEPKK